MLPTRVTCPPIPVRWALGVLEDHPPIDPNPDAIPNPRASAKGWPDRASRLTEPPDRCRRMGVAAGATPQNRKVMGVDRKPQPCLDCLGQSPKEIVGSLDQGATLSADEVRVGQRGQLIRGRTMAKMGMDDHP